MTILLLHLSDLHIQEKHDNILKKAKLIAATTFQDLSSISHLFIIISGDIAFSGKNDQYQLAIQFFTDIRDEILRELSVPINFIIVPGNHDCDFTLDSSARKMIISNFESANPLEIDDSIIDICTSIQKNFFEFRQQLENGNCSEDDLLWRSSRFTIENKTISFEAINVSWISKIHENSGSLYFPVEKYSSKKDEKIDVRILVLHHPLNWFNQSTYRPFRIFVRQLADIVISGHEHQNNVGIIHEAETEESVFIEGGVLQKDNKSTDSSFNIIKIDLNQGLFSSTFYQWDKSRYVPTENDSWSDYRNLPTKQNNPFPISELQQSILDDPGAFFSHPSRLNVTLSDIFIYPDLQKMNDNTQRKSFIRSSKLLSPDITATGILIEGEERSGRTSLLYQLYRQYHEQGFVPLLLRGKDIKRINDTEIDSLIKRAVKEQYNTACITLFQQQSSSHKLLLFDDFDEISIKSANDRAKLLCALRKRFKHLIVTVGDLFEMRELLDVDTSRELLALDHYQLQHFGYARRAELIECWFSLGANSSMTNEADLISNCDQAERLIDSIMAKSVVPSIPLYLLTILQGMEAGRTGDFKESALGHYYQYLLVGALNNSGVKPDKLAEFLNYSVHLSWEFHLQNKQEFSEIELRNFNSKFSDTWHTVDFIPRINVLLDARILCKRGNDYSFRYPYIYYFLKGQYLSENLTDSSIQQYIENCCKHLYVRDYANTVLFLAHHTNDDFILTTISHALHGLFETCIPLTFNGDTNAINQLIVDAPKLIYSGTSPAEYRKKRSLVRDDIDDGQDGLVESEESSNNLSLLAQITMLFKTIEILGQILKNQYSKIQRTKKVDLIEELFNAPLRALRDFYDFFEKNPDAFATEIEAAIQQKKNIQKDESQAIARKIVASFIQLVTFAFVLKTAQGANNDSLSEDIQNVVTRNGTLAFKLIKLCICLDSPKPIPKTELTEIIKDVDKDLIASRLLRIMLLNRLYMFKTTEKDMQWLNSKFDFDINMQHNITYQEKNRRLN